MSLQAVHSRLKYWSGSYLELKILHTIFSPFPTHCCTTLTLEKMQSWNWNLTKEISVPFVRVCGCCDSLWAQQQNSAYHLALEWQHTLQGRLCRSLCRLFHQIHLKHRWTILSFHLPCVFHQQFPNKIFCQVAGIAEKFFIKFIIHSCDVSERFLFSFSKERWCTTKPR